MPLWWGILKVAERSWPTYQQLYTAYLIHNIHKTVKKEIAVMTRCRHRPSKTVHWQLLRSPVDSRNPFSDRGAIGRTPGGFENRVFIVGLGMAAGRFDRPAVYFWGSGRGAAVNAVVPASDTSRGCVFLSCRLIVSKNKTKDCALIAGITPQSRLDYSIEVARYCQNNSKKRGRNCRESETRGENLRTAEENNDP